MTLGEAIKEYKFQLIIALLLLSGMYYAVIPDMVTVWYKDDNYSHGFLVPFIAGYFLYQRREQLENSSILPSNVGLAVIVLGLMQLVIAWLGSEYFTMRSSLIIILAGMVLYWFGWEILKIAAFPLAYLIFMVPIPYIIYDSVAFPLKLLVAKYSVISLKMLGITVLREGNIIMFPATSLEVADACSGIRSLMSLLALSVAYAFYIQVSTIKRWLIILSAVPIAVFTNGLRVFVTGILAQYWGEKAAQGFFHEFAGLVVFALAMVLLVLLGAIMRRVGK